MLHCFDYNRFIEKGKARMKDFICFENVRKVYHTGEVEIEALKNVNFTVGEGEFCVIVGASGAGKTTILNILGGMDSLTDGCVLLEGTDISKYDKRKLTEYRRYDVGFVFRSDNPTASSTSLAFRGFLHICAANSTFSSAVRFCTKL